MSNEDSESKSLPQLLGTISGKQNSLALLAQKKFVLFPYFALFLHLCSTPPKINNSSVKIALQAL